MTKPANLAFTIYQGATFRRGFRWCSCPYATKVVNGVLVNAATGARVPDSDLAPVDLTGCTARMQLRSDVLAPDVLLDLSTANGRIGLAEGDGWIRFVLDAATTSGLPFGDRPPLAWSTAIGQLEVEHPSGDVSRPVQVQWVLDPEGTR